MKVSTLWLNEWVKVPLTAQELADQLTMAGLEVDAVSPVAGAFTNVVVAEVLSTKPHPDADKLTICEVNANSGKNLQIVCGASNVRPGLKVALAMIGAVLPGDFKIKESKLRGELSQGMLCSVTELGLADQSEGIMELQFDAPVGKDLRDYLQLNDEVLDIDLTPNRADCFSILGVAREAAVLNKLSLKVPSVPKITPVIDDVVKIQLKNPEACAHYCGRVIRGINTNAVTPLWMTERLRRAGVRTLHPIVDITNYVMLELGQPMHAFDLATVKGDIQVRFSSDKEELELLDGKQLILNDKVLVIADQEKPLAMAGIMGGLASSVQEHTQDLFLESAFFNPITTAGVARKFGLFSDSSQRFERGVDSELQIEALERATELVLSIAGGKPGPIVEAIDPKHLPAKLTLNFDTTKVEKLTGVHIPVEEMKQLLEGLGLVIINTKNNVLEVQIPSHRFDLQLDVDLVEEIIRLYGYDKLQGQSINTVVQAGSMSANERLGAELTTWFRDRGYHETISYSFVDPQLQEALYPEAQCMQLVNPISSELAQMRAGMWPGLLASMIYNVHRQQNSIQFFEVGVVFEVNQNQLTERPCVAALLTGKKGAFSWNEPTRAFDFYDLKGDVESLLSVCKIKSVDFVAEAHPALHPGQSARLLIDGKPAGWLGALHPRLADALGLEQEVLLFELDLHSLINTKPSLYKAISKYPSISRDLSFLVARDITAKQIESAVRAAVTENWLKEFAVFDVYTGKGVPEDKKSVAISMLLQEESRTLVDTEINLLISAIIKSLENNFSIILRD